MHIYTYTYDTCKYIQIHAYMHSSQSQSGGDLDIGIVSDTGIYMQVHAYTYWYRHIWTPPKHTCMYKHYIYMYIYIHTYIISALTYNMQQHWKKVPVSCTYLACILYVFMHICAYWCAYICICAHMCSYCSTKGFGCKKICTHMSNMSIYERI